MLRFLKINMKVVISRQIKELRKNAHISIRVPTIMSGSRGGVRGGSGVQPPPPPSLFKIQISFRYIIKLPEYASDLLAISNKRRNPPPPPFLTDIQLTGALFLDLPDFGIC